jgi:hypothetical protein
MTRTELLQENQALREALRSIADQMDDVLGDEDLIESDDRDE